MSGVKEGGSVVIVGHGPSLKKAKLGKEIDACDVVVRLKNCSMLLAEPQNYGRRTDVMCSSTEVMNLLYKVKAKEYWGHPKKGSYSKSWVWQLQRKTGNKPVHVPLDLCNLWNAVFLELGGKHRNVSTGVAAAIIALDRLKPKVLYLAGFDKVWNPEADGYLSTVPTAFNKEGHADTGHDWLTERKLLPYLAAHFKVGIADLAGSNNIRPDGLHEVRKELPSVAS